MQTNSSFGAEPTDLHLLFGLGRYTFAIPVSSVRSVERPGRFTAVPLAAPWLAGVTAVRGAIVSVVDLGTFAGLGRAGQLPGARLLVTHAGGITTALLVDRVDRVLALPHELPSVPMREGPLADWWRGASTVEGEVVLAIDPERLFTSPAFHAYQQCAS